VTQKLLCLYHANCADGFASAWAVHRRFGDDVEFISVKYGEAPPPTAKRDVLIVDFSYPRPVLEAMAREARSVLVLDHHKTAAQDLAGLPDPVYPVEAWLDPNEREKQGERISSKNLAVLFDINRSGAGITWDYLHPNVPRPRIIDLVEDRDLWRFVHEPDTRRFHAVAASYGYEATPENFARWDQWTHIADSSRAVSWGSRGVGLEGESFMWHSLLSEGSAILRYEAKLIDGILRATRRTMRITSHIVPVACCPDALASEVGNEMCNNTPLSVFGSNDPIDKYYGDYTVTVPFAATYYDGADGRRHFSLRSPEGGADVGSIAKAMAAKFNADWQELCERSHDHRDGCFAGGGHQRASGFDAPLGWEEEDVS